MTGIFDFNNEGRKKVEGIHAVVCADIVEAKKNEELIKINLINEISKLIYKEFENLPLDINVVTECEKHRFKIGLDMILISKDEYKRLQYKDIKFKTPEEVYGKEILAPISIQADKVYIMQKEREREGE